MSATVRHAACRVFLDAVAYALAVDGAFPFCEHFEHSKIQDARRAFAKAFTGVKDFNARLAQPDSRKRHFVAVSHDARNLVYDNVIKDAKFRIFHHALKFQALNVAACLRIIAIDAHNVKAIVCAVFARFLYLDVNAFASLVMRTETCVNRRTCSL
ncbi:hypothetical protein ET524_10765 [Senegalimassilia faecalis]|uniref:Uncharacterized protein n=1 Tax=Senegalimassilia faecalis TaxID=2509433 RepID=A0A4Q2K464_9ACTN|nr:hypothetical protein [Senegalimassilia faecalis]RXZ54911.1 hypothetical protein ET524_10765 [Senegalimassilia faecalis]